MTHKALFLLIFSMCNILNYGTSSRTPRISHGYLHGLHEHPLIVGGTPAKLGELPYQLQIRFNGRHHCGGSIIVVQGVMLAITAAHCTSSGIKPESLTVVAGEVKLNDSTGWEQFRTVSKLVNHEGFDYNTVEHDISLLFLNKPFELNEYVQPIQLPEANAKFTGILTTSGWGKVSFNGTFSDDLFILEIPIVDRNVCRDAYANIGHIFNSSLCAGSVDGLGTCSGDSGGPGTSENGHLAGLVSWGKGCAEAEYPDVFTDVSFYINWIDQQVSKHLDTNKA